MAYTPELEEFCQVLISALNSIKKADEFPSYLSGKAREINAANINKQVEEQLGDPLILTQLMQAKVKSRICSHETIKSKENFLQFIGEYKPFIDRLKHGNFKLVLDRFMAAHLLAISISDLVDQILENEKIQEKMPANQI